MRISIFGLGYVGCVSAACLANEGHKIIGVDINPVKVAQLASGCSPVVEPGLDELVKRGVESGNLKVTVNGHEAVHMSHISLICVGTPSNDNGSLNLQYVENVCREIGKALVTKQDYHTIVFRSTVLPGTVEGRLIPLLEEFSGRSAGIDFGVCMNPEFLREGSAIHDYHNPSLIVIGELNKRSGDAVSELYKSLNTCVTRTDLPVAEMVKYASNAYHALKVVFANEIGNLSKANNIDGQAVMEIFRQDKQLNISAAYLNPGFAFGGSCLPKDLRALLYRAKETDVECPVLNAVLPSNRIQVELAVKLVERMKHKRVGILGLSFKANTDDLRESPAVSLGETLIGRGYHVRIFDEELQLSRLVGANKSFLDRELPHISELMCSSVEQLVDESEVVVITNGSESFKHIHHLLGQDKMLIDLVGIGKKNGNRQNVYEGICW